VVCLLEFNIADRSTDVCLVFGQAMKIQAAAQNEIVYFGSPADL
jgi:hypothetical protein